MSNVLELAHELIARPSITPDDAGCQRLIADRLSSAGFEAEWFQFDDVSNVLITVGARNPSVWFLGHTDVVPPGPLDDWQSPPFEPEVRDGRLYGRGAADMKGAVAAMVIALERFAQNRPDHAGQAGLLLTSDEEGLAEHGVRAVARVLESRGIAPDFCLVGAAAATNTATVDHNAPGFLTTWNCASTRPNVSHLNYDTSFVTNNSSQVATNSAGELCTYSSAASHVIVDVAGMWQ